MNHNLRQIPGENQRIMQAGGYEKDGRFIPFAHTRAEQEAVQVIDDSAISHALNHFQIIDGAKTEIKVINADSFFEKTDLVMNFANAYHPGGGYLYGASAQEESLCRQSTLYASISSRQASVMYQANIHSEDPLNTKYMLISPCVEIFRDRNLDLLNVPETTAVLTIAAPDLAHERKAQQLSQKTIDAFMKQRMREMLAICAEKGCRSLTLGAWGCGAFGHDARTVADEFYQVLIQEKMSTVFEKIVFAVLCRGNTYNYDAFEERFRQ